MNPIDQAPSRSIAAYRDAERVERYDRDMDLLHPNRHKMDEMALEVLPFERTDQLIALDLGIGTGFFTRRFLEKFPAATVIGIDGADEMLDLARARLEDAPGQVEYICSSFEDLERVLAADRTIDVAFSLHALHHLDVENKSRLVQSVTDRLRLGGWFLNADLVSSGFAEMDRTIRDLKIAGICLYGWLRFLQFAQGERFSGHENLKETTECSHRIIPAIKPKNKLIQITLEIFWVDAMMSSI